MPFAGFKDFSACVASMKKKGYTGDSPQKICGKLQAQSEAKKKKLEAEIKVEQIKIKKLEVERIMLSKLTTCKEK